MRQSAVGTFFHFLFGFVLFISLSFGVAYAANTFAAAKDRASTVASAEAAMLRVSH